MIKNLIISCSLDPNSHSSILAYKAYHIMQAREQSVEIIDLRNYQLPICNGFEQNAYDHPQVKALHDYIESAHTILLATPIYHQDVSASCKNLVELTGTPHQNGLSGQAWRNKIVGMITASTQETAYMAPINFIGSLILYFQCVIVPQFISVCANDFMQEHATTNINQRVEEQVIALQKMATALLT